MNIYYSLIFGTTAGKLYTLRIPGANEDAGQTAVKDAMNALIAANCIKTSRGDIARRESARLTKVTTTYFNI